MAAASHHTHRHAVCLPYLCCRCEGKLLIEYAAPGCDLTSSALQLVQALMEPPDVQGLLACDVEEWVSSCLTHSGIAATAAARYRPHRGKLTCCWKQTCAMLVANQESRRRWAGHTDDA